MYVVYSASGCSKIIFPGGAGPQTALEKTAYATVAFGSLDPPLEREHTLINMPVRHASVKIILCIIVEDAPRVLKSHNLLCISFAYLEHAPQVHVGACCSLVWRSLPNLTHAKN